MKVKRTYWHSTGTVAGGGGGAQGGRAGLGVGRGELDRHARGVGVAFRIAVSHGIFMSQIVHLVFSADLGRQIRERLDFVNSAVLFYL